MVDRALDILLCFRPDEPGLTLTQIAERVEKHKSTVHRLLATLERWRFIQHIEDDGTYHLAERIRKGTGREIVLACMGYVQTSISQNSLDDNGSQALTHKLVP